MRKKHIAPDHDFKNDNIAFVPTETNPRTVMLNTPKYNVGDLVEYRYNDIVGDNLPATILDNSLHNAMGHCLYKIFSTKFGYRQVHESVLYPIE